MFQPAEDGFVRVFENDFATPLSLMAAGDILWVLPGAYTISTVLSTALNDIKIKGVGTPGEAMLTGSGASLLTLTGTGVEVSGIGFTIASTKKAITLTGASRSHIHDNVFVSSVGGAASHFIHFLTTASNQVVIENNRFLTNLDVSAAGVTQTSHITLLGSGCVVQDNTFLAGRQTTDNAGAVTDALLINDAASAGNTVRRNTVLEFNGATFTAGFEWGASCTAGVALPSANNFVLGTATSAIVNTVGSAGFANNIANGTV